MLQQPNPDPHPGPGRLLPAPRPRASLGLPPTGGPSLLSPHLALRPAWCAASLEPHRPCSSSPHPLFPPRGRLPPAPHWAPNRSTCLPAQAPEPSASPAHSGCFWAKGGERSRGREAGKAALRRRPEGSQLGTLGGQALPSTHRPLGVLGRAHFFGVVSDLQRRRWLGTHSGQPGAAV